MTLDYVGVRFCQRCWIMMRIIGCEFPLYYYNKYQNFLNFTVKIKNFIKKTTFIIITVIFTEGAKNKLRGVPLFAGHSASHESHPFLPAHGYTTPQPSFYDHLVSTPFSKIFFFKNWGCISWHFCNDQKGIILLSLMYFFLLPPHKPVSSFGWHLPRSLKDDVIFFIIHTCPFKRYIIKCTYYISLFW